MITPKEKWAIGVGTLIVAYLVAGDHILPSHLQPTTLLSGTETQTEQTAQDVAPATAIPAPVTMTPAPAAAPQVIHDSRFQVTGFCMELLTVRYNKIDIYQMLSSGMQTHLIDQHREWNRAGGISQTPACVANLRSRLEDSLYQTLGKVGEHILGSMAHASALNLALDRCIKTAAPYC